MHVIVSLAWVPTIRRLPRTSTPHLSLKQGHSQPQTVLIMMLEQRQFPSTTPSSPIRDRSKGSFENCEDIFREIAGSTETEVESISEYFG